MAFFNRSKPQADALFREASAPEFAKLQLITGKGGVGRTTTAVALARACCARGETTLLLEVRDAESELGEVNAREAREDSMLGRALASSLEMEARSIPLGPIPTEVQKGIWAGQLVSAVGHEGYLSAVIPVERLVRAALESKPLARFLRSAPSMHELGIFYHLKQLTDDPRFDRVIVDLPASGHTLALTQLPARMTRLLKRGPIVEGLREGMKLLTDQRYTALWVVTLPERLPVTEALELAEALKGDGVSPAGVILNRCAPQKLGDREREEISKLLDQETLQTDLTARALLSSLLEEIDLNETLAVFSRCHRLPELTNAIARRDHVLSHWLVTPSQEEIADV